MPPLTPCSVMHQRQGTHDASDETEQTPEPAVSERKKTSSLQAFKDVGIRPCHELGFKIATAAANSGQTWPPRRRDAIKPAAPRRPRHGKTGFLTFGAAQLLLPEAARPRAPLPLGLVALAA